MILPSLFFKQQFHPLDSNLKVLSHTFPLLYIILHFQKLKNPPWEILDRKQKCFAKDHSKLSITIVYEHHILTLLDARPVKISFYWVSPSIQKGMRKHVDDMLENDVIEPSKYVWHSPVVMAKKRYRK